MKYIALALLIAVVASQTTVPTWVYDSFDHWCTKFSKTYDSPTERTFRVGVYYTNIQYIYATNAKQSSFTLAVNQFADLTQAEFVEMYTGLSTPKITTTTTTATTTIRKAQNIPASIDWTTLGAVTPIKNQGQCGSCWAFSTTGSLEGVYAITTGTLNSYSEQQLVDCSEAYGNYGCDGGLMDNAFEYVMAQGIELESVYPYVAVDQTCAYNAANVIFKNTGFTNVTP